MQDEINEKVVALSVKGAKLTAEMLQKAIKAMLAQAKKQQEKQPHGKQTLKQLAKQNAGLSNIEITEGNIKANIVAVSGFVKNQSSCFLCHVVNPPFFVYRLSPSL